MDVSKLQLKAEVMTTKLDMINVTFTKLRHISALKRSIAIFYVDGNRRPPRTVKRLHKTLGIEI